jgi:Family of unknown function (DUF6502)
MALEKIYLEQMNRILRPLVRLLIENGVTYAAMSEKLKRLFYEVALEREKERGGKITDSRLSLATGMYRRDLRKLKEDMLLTDESSGHKSLARSIVSGWLTNLPFIDEEGLGRALPFSAEDPKQPSFENLIATYTTDIRARTIWDEWLSQRIITLDTKGRAVYSRVQSDTNEEDAIATSGWLLSTHAEALANNLMNRAPRAAATMFSIDELSKTQAEQFAIVNAKDMRRIMQKALAITSKEIATRGAEEKDPHTAYIGVYAFVKKGNHADDDFMPKRS